MHDVSNAINILDPSEGIDKKICQDKWHTGTTETAGKCISGGNSSSATKLSEMFKEGDAKNNYATTRESKMASITSGEISKDVSTNLTREEKGVVSSAFAKAHEGA